MFCLNSNLIKLTITLLVVFVFSCRDNVINDVVEESIPKPSKPSLSGNATVGKTLTATLQTAPDGYSRVIKWYRNGTLVSGITGITYVLNRIDIGHKISVGVYFKKGDKRGEEVKSEPTEVVKDDVDKSIPKPSKPTLSGETVVGKTLTATVASAPDGYSRVIQWYRDNVTIPSANGTNYVLKWADLGSRISVGVYFTKGDKIGIEVKSEPTEVVKSGMGPFVVNDPMYKDQWYLKNTGQDGGVAGLDINVEPVWKLGYLGQGINVAVVDAQIDREHPDLKPNILSIRNHITLTDTQVCKSNHGTPPAGIIAGKDNLIGIIGVAPRAKIYGHTVTGTGSIQPVETFIKAFTDPKNIAVYSCSWTISADIYEPEPLKLHKYFDKGIKEGFGGKGSSYVFSSGNFPISSIAVSAEFSHHAVIAVPGITKKGKLGGAAKWGACHWVGAFTKDVLSSDRTDGASGKCGYDIGNYTKFSGTSAATPIVAGVVALIRQANPLLTYRDVKLILAESAKKDKVQISDNIWHDTGETYTKNTDKYAYSKWMGFGLVDAYAAVKMAKDWKLLPPQKVEEYTSEASITIQSDIQKEITIQVNGSAINFVEYIQFSMDFRNDKYVLIALGIEIVNPKGESFKLTNKDQIFGNLYNNRTIPFATGYNYYLGKNTPNGQWKIKISCNNDILSVENFKIKIYGH